jgi:hypothetical protein
VPIQTQDNTVIGRMRRFMTISPDEAHNRRRFIFLLVMLCVVVVGWELVFSSDSSRVTLINNFLSTILWLVGIYVGGSVAAGPLPVLQEGAISRGLDSTTERTTLGAMHPDALVRLSDDTVGRASLASFVSATTFGHTAEIQEAKKYLDALQAAAVATALDPILLCAVVSRESAWGLTLKPPGPAGTGDFTRRSPATWHCELPPDGLGWGRGLMQIDYQQEFAKSGDWKDPAGNILYGSRLLKANIDYFTAAANGLNVPDPVRAGVAAYNCGRGNVHKALGNKMDVDTYSTGNNYSADVMQRMSLVYVLVCGGGGGVISNAAPLWARFGFDNRHSQE